jgi:Cysteine-rich secretory protein family
MPATDRRTPRLRQLACRRFVRRLVPQALALSFVAALVATAATPGSAGAIADDDWLGIVNTYRAMSGLESVTANGTWSAQGQAHSCYMLLNGISHDEIPGRPGYTTGGDTAGNSGNVAVSSAPSATARNHIDLWMTGPFHAIGILRHNLRSSGFGLCSATDAPTPWRSGGTLDVIRGIDSSVPRPASPIVFPGNGATVPLHSFITESPNPMTMCGWTGSAGLPLIAMMPGGVGAANASLSGPSGPIETCVLHGGNASDGTARAILAGDNAVVVMPRTPLADGTYTATVNTDGGGSVTWSFTVDRNAPLSSSPTTPPPATPTSAAAPPARFRPVAPFRSVDSRIGLGSVRLAGGAVTRIPVSSDPTVVAVSANFVSTAPSGAGYLSTYNCTTNLPEVSTLGYQAGGAVANQAFVPLSNGAMCLFSLVDTDVVVDINGYYHSGGGGGGFTPVTPARLYDSRDAGARFAPGEERALRVTGVTPGAPAGSSAVALNLTAIQPDGPGYVRVYPCGSPAAAEISSINFGTSEVRANSVVTPVGADGTICVQASTGIDVAFDLAGYFGTTGFDFQPLVPVRMFDSRFRTSDLNQVTNGLPVGAGQVVTLRVAGHQGIPTSAKAASVNITAVDTGQASFVTAYPCGARPLASNVNITPAQGANANGAMVKLSATGDLCLYSANPVHVVVDINGVWI